MIDINPLSVSRMLNHVQTDDLRVMNVRQWSCDCSFKAETQHVTFCIEGLIQKTDLRSVLILK